MYFFSYLFSTRGKIFEYFHAIFENDSVIDSVVLVQSVITYAPEMLLAHFDDIVVNLLGKRSVCVIWRLYRYIYYMTT